jgi:gamma-glutamylaminecyclotransferase
VYGSLKRGAEHHRELSSARFVGEARTTSGYRLVRYGAYPAMTAGDHAVVGELYEVDSALLERLDDFEGCPTLYRRGSAHLSDEREAIAYIIGAERARGCHEISGGYWPER